MIKVVKTRKELARKSLNFKAYFQEKNIQNSAKVEELATVLRKFYAKVRTHSHRFCVFTALEIF